MKKALVLVMALVVVCFTMFLFRPGVASQSHLIGTFTTLSDPEISKNILKFVETKNDMYCQIKEYGHDNKFVFAWVDCGAFKFLPTNGEITEESGFSKPIRFEYDWKSKKIVGYTEPEDGANYEPSLRKMWPVELSLNPGPVFQNTSWFPKKRYIELKFPKVWIALQIIELKLEKYKNWEAQQSFAGKKVYLREKDGEVLFNFVVEGSGVRIVEQNCVKVDKNGAVSTVNPKICAGLGEVM